MAVHSISGGLVRRVSGKIFNSHGVHVAVVVGSQIFDLTGNNRYILRGTKIYRLSGELVGHLTHAGGLDKRLDRSTDRLFSRGRPRFHGKVEREGT